MTFDLQAQLEEQRDRHNRLSDEMNTIVDRSKGASMSRGDHERYTNLERGRSAALAEFRRIEREIQTGRVAQAGAYPENTGDGSVYTSSRPFSRGALPDATSAQRQAHAAIDFGVRENRIVTRDADRLANLIDSDQAGLDAGYLAAVADDDYQTAFAKVLGHGAQAALRMTTGEAEAMRNALAASERRERFASGFMASGISVGGGDLPLPLSVDPTIQLSSPGVVDPFRDNAQVVTISTQSYKLGTSASMTAAWAEEGTEVTDGSPTISPVTITPQRAHTFAVYSFEASEDWAALSNNLMKMLADAKQELEADAWLNGAGEDSYEPQGLIAGASTAVVNTSSTATALEVTDMTLAQDDLEPRYQPNAQWFTNLGTRNLIDQIVAQADATHAKITDLQGNILRRPWNEVSKMDTVAASNKPVVYGDLRQAYRIVDRIGMSVQLVPQVFGTVANLPTGQSGLYCWWRTSAALVDEQAIRIIQMHS